MSRRVMPGWREMVPTTFRARPIGAMVADMVAPPPRCYGWESVYRLPVVVFHVRRFAISET